MTDRLIGADLDAAGVTLDLEDGDTVEALVVIARVSRTDGPRTVVLGGDRRLDWYDQHALITLAKEIIRGDV